MTILTILLAFFFILNFILSGIVIFLERRNIGATWAWLLVLLFIPVAGFIIYLIFGQNLSRRRIFYWKDQEKIGIKEISQRQIDMLRNNNFPFHDERTVQYKELVYMLLVNDDAVMSHDNDVEIFIDGDDKFQSLFEDIRKAKDHIHLLYYIVRDDLLGQKLVELLTIKAKEGVTVRFVYDDMGSRRLPRKFFKSLVDAGGQVASFFPAKIPMLNLRVNFRNHRKLAIIDGNIGYIGGFNIGDEYLGLNKRFGYWRDTHLKITGKAVYAMQTRFILDWNQASSKEIRYEERYFPDIPSIGYTDVQIVSSGPDSEWEQIKNGYIKMINSAKKYIFMQTPYFIPDDSLLNAIKIAILSGVDVRLMIPNKPDHMFVYWATYSYVGELLKTGAKVYIYDNGFIHAKMLVVDGKIATVGTANIDNRSFRLNFEVNAFLYSHHISKKLEKIYMDDMGKSKELTLEEYLLRPKWIRFKESISRLLSPIL
ncbi:cardiolipin synthase [Heyndrickxia oleronia]|jgi:cardiolipin synthase|uniref:Cardiolipin synthase n=1 Tax=Heyndrickxia oleronia TaxID=38875 RepID=A0AAW6SWV5_9BACI|nr:cardiolipin synthase [Heyndrickxia oleronia]MCI1590061.1 cardiolipin synthase [Heyndrickxia oleronia]MCI1613752.1 cardiolipin synthase [Heyndrickxia oleronia]MCI1744882.1 cardiolipin synthase [Heyndrickxia oleronia]MCI1761731.1 cardiolipin synthase [Heyndrickxia oleronia]MCM3238327.1 cardiolipin synthase [Heyndrickxia oleronia]